jgi:hypothetical protein
MFYSTRFRETFGELAKYLGWDDPNTTFSRFMYRGFVVTAGFVLVVLGIAALFGPISI